ncbi:LysE family translocator [Thalassospira tepidiphila]|uniref:Lysine transporter LysE n=2 Tax=Thalassospira tepidiphila TaxID=393657 RepID=A0A853L328_9PROT|nr:LysE family translocator [Thalassospira tepidiphila]NJB73218.1 threonine/homoserine/homoserine lactone efflux protein [Thalassospira tepidiphila]OAZ11067.1 lysine transporter LysE [Thalassospira tepidiphila MCCC 1A03514]
MPEWTGDILSMEIIAVGIITILAVISPGPDFAMVTRIALARGRRAGVLCAIGIGTGVSVHLGYTLIGLGVVFASNIWVLSALRYLGAAYLIWLGVSALWPDIQRLLGRPNHSKSASNVTNSDQPNQNQTRRAQNSGSAFWIGFACNALNPKTMLFIVSLFSQVISPDTAIIQEVAYGVYIAACHMIWFALVATALTLPSVQARIAAIKSWIERGVGICLAGLGVKLLAS